MSIGNIKYNGRNSSVELLRIILMVFIVMHHVINSVIAPNFSLHAWACVDVILHTAVIVFVLISGYFGIKFSWKRFFSLLLQVIFYSLLLQLVVGLIKGNVNLWVIPLAFFPFNNNYYWFVETYLQLYLLAFILNKLNDHCSDKEFFSVLGVLAFFVFYMGFLWKNEICSDGKNIVNFVMIYELGYGLNRFPSFYKGKSRMVFFLTVTLLIIIGLCYFIPDDNNLFVHTIAFLYKYNSPFLILLSVLIFILFLNMHLKSGWINYLAASSFSIYLVHEHPLFREIVYVKPFKELMQLGYDDFSLLCIVFIFAVLLSIICMISDKIRIYLFSFIFK